MKTPQIESLPGFSPLGIKPRDLCPHCGEDRAHPSQLIRGGHVSTATPQGNIVCGTAGSK